MIRTIRPVAFFHGDGRDAVELSVQMPVWSCDACDFGYEGEEGEVMRHEAVCRHVGRLTPSEIRGIRTACDLTRADVSSLTGFDVASVGRWEAGNQIQSASADVALRALSDRVRGANPG